MLVKMYALIILISILSEALQVPLSCQPRTWYCNSACCLLARQPVTLKHASTSVPYHQPIVQQNTDAANPKYILVPGTAVDT